MSEISTDILISCNDENRRGGIKRVFVINKDDVTTFTASTDNHSYTAVTLSTTDDKFFEIEGELETKLYSSEGSRENGSISYETSLEVFAPKMEVMFEGIGKRSFSYSFVFTPSSEDEAAEVQRIIKAFRFHAAADFASA
mgnify:CR=1 FL=1